MRVVEGQIDRGTLTSKGICRAATPYQYKQTATQQQQSCGPDRLHTQVSLGRPILRSMQLSQGSQTRHGWLAGWLEGTVTVTKDRGALLFLALAFSFFLLRCFHSNFGPPTAAEMD